MSLDLINLIVQATAESLFMVSIAALVATSFGLPLGIFLATSRKGELFAAPSANAVLGVIVNATRSTPFIILVVAMPFIARLVEAAIREVDGGLIETASSFGASPLQIVFKVLIPEALPGLVLALTLAVVSLLGYSAMVGAVGGGGLGDLGIRYGYQRFMPDMMLAVVVVLIALVQSVQTVGDYLARRLNRRLRHR
jgi:D-methionine transport system permease protein